MSDVFSRSLYRPDDRDRKMFGDHYDPPAEFEHWVEHRVAVFEKTSEDGYVVEIYEARAPARFFRLRALPGPNSIGEERPGFTMTGSGDEVGSLLVKIAEAVADGMLGMKGD